MRIKSLLIVSAVILAACTPEPEKQAQQIGIQSLVYTQKSAEIEALYLQGYNVATDRIREAQFDKMAKKPAVTLDLDETVLDNSPFNAKLLLDNMSYSPDLWDEWCERREALPLPGALDFTKFAQSSGVEVFYVSNRTENLLDATIDNMQKLGFPNSDTTHILLKTTTSSKDARREKIREEYEIILLLGDNLGDFDGIFDNREMNMGKNNVYEAGASFGRQFIMFPNAMYGGWQKAAYPEGIPDAQGMIESLRAY